MADGYHNEIVRIASKGLYFRVNTIVGPECIIKQRRQRHDVHEKFASCNSSYPLTLIPSGSTAEGFNFKSSDIDTMYIIKNIIVLSSTVGHISDMTNLFIILSMETDLVPPGFTLLRCLRYNNLFSGLAPPMRYSVYFSSKVFRESYDPGVISYLHGPCKSFEFLGQEIDFAPTLRCPIWPKVAMSFIYRSLRNGWPYHGVLTDICNDGCLLVPINSKQQTCSEFVDFEWRISFSLAEKKLIHSMNNCQFLCYGLMKIFLNEVLKKIPEVEDLLCSYFMKTAVFWEILEFKNNWSQNNFIMKFWNVFRRVIKWVSVGYCPNFFIPQHNMFYGKIYGRQQRHLMMRLGSLYNEGYMCLLRCSSLQTVLSLGINIPFLFHIVPENVDLCIPHHQLEEEKLQTTISFLLLFSTDNRIDVLQRLLYNTASLISSSDEVSSAIKLRVNAILQRIAVLFHSYSSKSNQGYFSNRFNYSFCKTSQSILRRTKSFFCYNTLLRAVCSYRNAEYKKTIEIVNHIKHKLARQLYMCSWNLYGDLIHDYREQGMSLDAIVKSFIICHYIYEHEFSIDELRPESYAAFKITEAGRLLISPFVFLNFLSILCHTRLNQAYDRTEVLCELQTLISTDDGYHISRQCEAISWEILGVSQQLCGDYHGAYQSYMKALNDQHNYFKQATIIRIITLLYDLNIVHR